MPKTITAEEFKQLPEIPQNWNPTLDIGGLRKKYSGPPRPQMVTGVCSLPWGEHGELRREALRKKVERFVRLMEARGFRLLDRPVVNGPFPYRDLDSVVILDRQEYQIRASFAPKPVPVKLEVAVA